MPKKKSYDAHRWRNDVMNLTICIQNISNI